MSRIGALSISLTLIASPLFAQRGSDTPLPNTPLLPLAEEAALAASGAPAHISDDATIHVRTAEGLVVHRRGTNGYECLVERFGVANTVWPTCYHPDAAPLFILKNRLLEEHRARRETRTAFTEAYESAIGRGEVPLPGGGGISYRLSPHAYTETPEGRQSLWMVIIASAYLDAAAGLSREHAEAWNGIEPTFGVAAPGKADAYFWTRIGKLPASVGVAAVK